MRLRLLATLLPFCLLALTLGCIAAVTYLQPRTGTVMAVYPQNVQDPLLEASAHADAILASDKTKHSAILVISSPAQWKALRDQGAWVLHPKGVSSCMQP
jgi:hypothetical protein